LIKDNRQQTLQYFSNISTVREKCTKEQLSEIVDLYNQKNALNSSILRFPSNREDICPRRKKHMFLSFGAGGTALNSR